MEETKGEGRSVLSGRSTEYSSVNHQLRRYYQASDQNFLTQLDVGEKRAAIKIDDLFVNLVIVEDMTQQLQAIKQSGRATEYQEQFTEEDEQEEQTRATAPTRLASSLSSGYAMGMRLLNSIETVRRDLDQDLGVMFDGEGVYSQKRPVEISHLFNNYQLANGDDVQSPKKLLLLGRAGIGKTVLCRYLTQRWAKGHLWSGGAGQKSFQWVFFLRLKEVQKYYKNKAPVTDVADILYDMVLSHDAQGKIQSRAAAREFWQKLLDSNDNILLLLDGYDEVVARGEQSSTDRHCELLMSASQQRKNIHLFITSRPYVQVTQDVDVVFENVGFREEDVEDYIDRYFGFNASDNCASHEETPKIRCDAQTQADGLKQWINQRAKVKQLCQIPINIEFICSIWLTEGENLANEDVVMSALYKRITGKLITRFFLKKRYESDYYTIRAKSIFIYFETYGILNYLSTCAFEGFKSGNLILDSKIFTEVQQKQELQPDAVKDYLSVGFLNSVGVVEGAALEADYYFIHLSFQEYLVGWYFALKLLENKLSDDDKAFMQAHRYDPAYQLVWTYVVGVIHGYDGKPTIEAIDLNELVRIKRQAINRFFNDFLLSGHRDLYGVYELELLVRCGEEAKWSSEYRILQDLLEHLGHQVMSIERIRNDKTKAALFKHLTQLFLSCPIAMERIKYRNATGLFEFMSKKSQIPKWSKNLHRLNANLLLLESSQQLIKKRGVGKSYAHAVGYFEIAVSLFIVEPIADLFNATIKAIGKHLTENKNVYQTILATILVILTFPSLVVGFAINKIVQLLTGTLTTENRDALIAEEALAALSDKFDQVILSLQEVFASLRQQQSHFISFERSCFQSIASLLLLIIFGLIDVPILASLFAVAAFSVISLLTLAALCVGFYAPTFALLLSVYLVGVAAIGLPPLFSIIAAMSVFVSFRSLCHLPFLLLNAVMWPLSLLNEVYFQPFFQLRNENAMRFLAQFQFKDIAPTKRLLALIEQTESKNCLPMVELLNKQAFDYAMLSLLEIALRNRLLSDANVLLQWACYNKLQEISAESRYEERIVIVNASFIALAQCYQSMVTSEQRVKRLMKLLDSNFGNQKTEAVQEAAKFLAEQKELLPQVISAPQHAIAITAQLLHKKLQNEFNEELAQGLQKIIGLLEWQGAYARHDVTQTTYSAILETVSNAHETAVLIPRLSRSVRQHTRATRTNHSSNHQRQSTARRQDNRRRQTGQIRLHNIDRLMSNLASSVSVISFISIDSMNAVENKLKDLRSIADYEGNENELLKLAIAAIRKVLHSHSKHRFFIDVVQITFAAAISLPAWLIIFYPLMSFSVAYLFSFPFLLAAALRAIISLICWFRLMCNYLLPSDFHGYRYSMGSMFSMNFNSKALLPRIVGYISLVSGGLFGFINAFGMMHYIDQLPGPNWTKIFFGVLVGISLVMITAGLMGLSALLIFYGFYYDYQQPAIKMINAAIMLIQQPSLFPALLKHYPHFYTKKYREIFITILREQLQSHLTAIYQNDDGSFSWYQGRKLLTFHCDNPWTLRRDIQGIRPLRGRFTGQSMWSSCMSFFTDATGADEEVESYVPEDRFAAQWEESLNQLEISHPIDAPLAESAPRNQEGRLFRLPFDIEQGYRSVFNPRTAG